MTFPRSLWKAGGRLLAATGALGAGVLAVEAVAASLRSGLAAESAPPISDVLGPDDAPPLRLAVMGDSTASGVGVSERSDTVAGRLAAALAEDGYRVTVDGLAVAGSRAADLAPQVSRALSHGSPDIAVILIGANDATHFTGRGSVTDDLATAVRRLRTAEVPVIVGSCPDLGAVRAYLQPLRLLAAWQGRRIAQAQSRGARDEGAVVVDLAAETGPVFRADPGTLSEDLFHPSADGYRLWAAALLPAVREAATLVGGTRS